MTDERADQGAAGSDAESGARHIHDLIVEGTQLLSLRRPGEAVVKLEEAYRLDPYNVAAAINLSSAYMLQSKFRQAVPVLEAASSLEPDNVMIWSNLAAAYLGKLPFATTEAQDRAIKAYERALALDAGAPHIHYNLGLIYLERKDQQQARLHFEQALANDPSDRDAKQYLGKLQRGEV